jgi:hypothetical protein
MLIFMPPQINLRPGGATHPIMTLNLLTDGHYDEATGLYTLNEDSTVYAGRLGEDQRYCSFSWTQACNQGFGFRD